LISEIFWVGVGVEMLSFSEPSIFQHTQNVTKHSRMVLAQAALLQKPQQGMDLHHVSLCKIYINKK
jgi:hypothetical protein